MISTNPLPTDPIKFKNKFWPDIDFYKEQEEIIYSVQDNIETVVPAGNALGKDFIAAFIALWFFCSRRPARVVTTSVSEGQLIDVLWGEINWFIENAEYKLPIQYNHGKIRQIYDDGSFVPKCEIIAKVVKKSEGLLGRHLPKTVVEPYLKREFEILGYNMEGSYEVPRTLVIFDEASGIDDKTYESCLTWSHRRLIIGNPWPCENYFRKAVEGGDKLNKVVE